MRIGVDAFNLAADRRGMGRLVRQTLERLRALQNVEVLPILPQPESGGITPRDLRRLGLDAVWYPWNGMRFAPHAPSIVTINDTFAFTYPHHNLVARWREQTPIRRAIRKADCIFTISRWGASEVQRLFRVPDSRLRVVLPAIDPFWKPVPAQQTIPAYMLFVGGPDARKNAALLFSAYDAAFAEGGPELVVVGNLNDADERRFIEMRSKRRRIAPEDEELRALYSGALAVLVPSAAEGYGLPVIEGMACGAPVVAADATALPEAADGAALLVSAGDVDAWVEALQRIAQDEALREDLRQRGYARVRRIDPDGPASALIECAQQLRGAVR